MSDTGTHDDEPRMTFTVAQTRALLRAFQAVPVTGLHHQYVGAADDPERVIAHVRAMGEALSRALSDNERLNNEAVATERDLRAAGRVFARMHIC